MNVIIRCLFINCFACLFALVPGISQSSFTRALSIPTLPPSALIAIYEMDIAPDGGVSMAPTIGQNTMNVISLSSEGNIQNAYRLSTNTNNTWRRTPGYDRAGNYHLVHAAGQLAQNNRSAVFGLNFETNSFWGQQVGLNAAAYSEIYISADEAALFTNKIHAPQSQNLSLSKLAMEDGAFIWGYNYQKTGQNDITQYDAYNIQEFPEGSFSIAGKTRHVNNEQSEYLLKLSAGGLPLKGVAIRNDSINFYGHSIDGNGNVFVAGAVVTDTLRPFPLPGSTLMLQDGFIVKLNADYTLQWAKQLKAEQFPCTDLSIRAFPDGSLIFMYVTFGYFPVIVGKISSTGDLLWYRGYSLNSPQAVAGLDSSVYLLSRNILPGENAPVTIFKTDPEGNLADCPQFAACVSLVDMPFPLETWQWTSEVTGPLPEIEVHATPIDFESTPYCNTPERPSALFSLLDTACQHSCLSPGDLKNRLANYNQWRLTGPGVDTIIVDSTFSWCYNLSGRYTVEQEVWLLGCSEFYSREIEILPDDLAPPLGEDRNLCNEPPYALIPQSSRPLRTFLWNDGSSDSSLPVPVSGTYSLTATNGYCSVSDSVVLHFVAEGLTEPPLLTGPDTTLCPVFLPYLLHPYSPYAQDFFLDNQPQPAQEFALSEPGSYTITTFIEGCPFLETFNLVVQPCPVPIYLPNVFSPNDDGINDRCFPQGEDFESLRLEVYDRWGGLLYRTDAAPFSWDGDAQGKALNTGVYVVHFRYTNLRTLQQEHLTREVLLLR